MKKIIEAFLLTCVLTFLTLRTFFCVSVDSISHAFQCHGLSDCLYEEQLESEPEESEGGLGADGIGDGDACRWPLLTVGICRYLF